MFRIDFFALFAAFGAFQGILFALILWFRKKATISNKIFSLLLLVTSIRIAKNIVVHIKLLDPDLKMSYEVWHLLVNIGITHQFAIGPLFVLFFISRTKEKFKLNKWYLLHFLPYTLMMIYSPFQEWASWTSWGLWASYISILSYFLVAVWIYIMSFKKNGTTEGLKWLRNLLIICGLMLLAYSPALFKYIGYIGGAVMYAIGIYVVGALVLGKGMFFTYFQNKYPGSSINLKESQGTLAELERMMNMEQRYIDSQLSLAKLATELNISAHTLSQLINSQYQKSFTDYINGFRINKAKEMLCNPDHQKTKIISIAFDSGFNGLSTFNTVFKKQVGIPPNQYRKDNCSQ